MKTLTTLLGIIIGLALLCGVGYGALIGFRFVRAYWSTVAPDLRTIFTLASALLLFCTLMSVPVWVIVLKIEHHCLTIVLYNSLHLFHPK